ncbi:MAG TPA: hypothetical protein VJ805_06505 [Nitrospiraceae bacterium]|nr:hypothetical protein [Nitrospiraceae bacterium]
MRFCRRLLCGTGLLSALLGPAFWSADLVGAASTASTIEAQPAALAGTMPDWTKIRATAASVMDKPAAGTDPLVYFIDPLGRQLGFPDAVSTLAAKKLPPALAAELGVAELAETARHLIRSLVGWNIARAIRELASATDEAEIDRLGRHIADQAAWLTPETEGGAARFILASIPALKSTAAEAGALDEAAYRDYAAVLDAKYPMQPSNLDSWLAILETNGIEAWHDRLRAGMDGKTFDPQDFQVMAGRYITSRLQPLLRLRLAQQGSELETWAAQRAYQDWVSLSGWKDSVRLRRGLARLCGSWQWTIHNHQNHGEQKLTVNFPASGSGQDHAGPAEIVVLGDSVYLRWEAGGRVQEDSLLLSKEGQRLEGSFVNNMGGWGSITGKRTAGCPRK